MLTRNLEIIKGNDRTYTMTLSDSSGVIDITLWTISFVVKKGTATIINKEITDHADPVHGISKIILTNQDTNIAAGKYRFSIAVQTGAGKVFTVLAGSLTVRG